MEFRIWSSELSEKMLKVSCKLLITKLCLFFFFFPQDLFYIWVLYLHLYPCARTGLQIPIDGCEPPGDCWELNSAPLENSQCSNGWSIPPALRLIVKVYPHVCAPHHHMNCRISRLTDTSFTILHTFLFFFFWWSWGMIDSEEVSAPF